ncbi:Long-chain-fatty-acid--CoA ligase [Microbacterium ginsengisoli]|uniref:Long-chain-fatty-acid--CoA ligase n=1 Tax=Microbacterium ginsengisoli TaxID=400772 RepID=A0A0F0LY88_9MICO|nr:AMP-binding protein [Microbacterium ginsengisoli]KJL37220.1 Long-chain-fatty-acid--CoA ligase [Microbacterium ginsengisoli]MBN9180201.1 AMP-binding protein [Microbacterium sp.]
MIDSSPLTQLPWAGPAAGSARPCVQDVHRALTYAQLEDEARAFAEQLDELGIRQGDVIGIMLPNSVELVVATLGAWIRGVVATPINPTLTAREVSYQLEDSRARLLVGAAMEGVDVPSLAADELRRSATSRDAITVDPDRLALLVYTSGSTGSPKGVMLDHRNLEAMATSMAQHFGLTASDHALLVLPLFHVNSICVTLLAPFTVGARVTVLERFAPRSFVDAMERFQPTYFSAVPAIFAHLAALPADERVETRRLRFAVCGAAPVSPELLQRCESRFGMSITEGYGLTEATCASACNPVSGIRKPGTVGPALPGQRIRVVDPRGEDVPTGERGEVAISGPTVMRGYLNRIEATAEAIPDGWLRTGDVGILDEDGYLRIVDRIKDMIIRGGENIYPKEIESVLATHSAVLEAAVVGRPDPVLGEVPVAFVVLAPGAEVDADALIAHCRLGLAKIKVPVALEILDALPRNPVGKVDKPALRHSLAAV